MTHQVEQPEHTLHLNGIHAVTMDTIEVGELVNNLIIAMRENERSHTTIEGCNKAMRKHCEVDENRQHKTENLKAILEVKIVQPENTTKSLQDQLSFRPAYDKWKCEQGVSQLTGKVNHSADNVAAF